jgi:hypothetical protein
MRIVWLMVLVAAYLAADSGAGVQWTQPKNWQKQAQRPMRLATYLVPEGGECGVYYFGPGQGGSVQANLDRWIGQFPQPDEKPNIQNKTIHGLKVTTVDVAGAYTGMGGPNAPASAPKPGYRLLGAIVETSQGSIFFKFTGPRKTVAANQAGFDAMVDSLAPILIDTFDRPR